MAEPLQVVWDALDRGDFDPHGPLHAYRARCPGHDGTGREALHVSEGTDRRVLLHCFARQCEPRLILERLGLQVGDLFPAGHHKARRSGPVSVRTSDLTEQAQVVARTLRDLNAAGMPWEAMVMCDCPFCGGPGAWLRTSSRRGNVPVVDCPEGCGPREFTLALQARRAGLMA